MAPILFIHYGPASYLRLALRCARMTNPEKRIVLLGDESNRKYASGYAEFFPFRDFSYGEKSCNFENVFQVIQGDRHRFTKQGGVETWLKFVFQRWFFLEEFLSREGEDAFWTFDSDTLILSPLGSREKRFVHVEATTQCRGQCLNGWVGSANLVRRYTSFILESFRDVGFLDAQREWVRLHAGLAFNEMDAFREFRQRHEISTCHAAQAMAGEAFDDALAFVEDYEVSPVNILGKTIVKRLWTSRNGGIWARNASGYVRLLTCNMSWMPHYLWKKIFRCGPGVESSGCSNTQQVDGLFELNLREPFLAGFARIFLSWWWWLRCFFRKVKNVLGS